MTVATSSDRKSGLTLVGVAAHITAASVEGPRYDSSMSAEERSSESNGIWACQIHGKFIDDNPSSCTVDELRRWKSQHESWIFKRVESGRELSTTGIAKVEIQNTGVFKEKCQVDLGRNNIILGLNEAGKTTLCQVLPPTEN